MIIDNFNLFQNRCISFKNLWNGYINILGRPIPGKKLGITPKINYKNFLLHNLV